MSHVSTRSAWVPHVSGSLIKSNICLLYISLVTTLIDIHYKLNFCWTNVDQIWSGENLANAFEPSVVYISSYTYI